MQDSQRWQTPGQTNKQMNSFNLSFFSWGHADEEAMPILRQTVSNTMMNILVQKSSFSDASQPMQRLQPGIKQTNKWTQLISVF